MTSPIQVTGSSTGCPRPNRCGCQRCRGRHPVDGASSGGIGVTGPNAGGGGQFYVLLPDGVQKINSRGRSAAQRELLRAAAPGGDPDVLVHTPQVTSLQVGTTTRPGG